MIIYTKKGVVKMTTPKIRGITRWAAYPSSQVLLRVRREPFRPLQFTIMY